MRWGLFYLLALRALAIAQIPLDDDSAAQYKVYRSQTTDHVVRIKPQNDTICDARTKQWTGWLSSGPKHLFFWYFDISPQSPNKDSLTVWLTGGPGASSMGALFGENGPCTVAKKGESTKHNPYGWTQASSMLFVDQPAGVGFSYVDADTPMPDNSFTAAEDLTAFMHIFLGQVFPDKAKIPFHISGESYAGHYVPAFAAEVSRQNIANPRRPHIPLTSVLIGNGFISPLDSTFGYWETLCTTKPGVEEPVFNSTRCDIIAETMPRCTQLIKTCYQNPDPAICNAAYGICYGGIMGLFYEESYKGGRNPFDITHRCELDMFCYENVNDMSRYLNKRRVWDALDVPSAVKKWSYFNEHMNHVFDRGVEIFISTQPQVKYLLKQGIDVLIYQGNLDLACNTAGNLHWANNMPWKGQTEFSSKSLTPWSAEINGKQKSVGTFKEVSIKMNESDRKVRFALVTVNDAGHMLPQDQPEASLELVSRWLSKKSFDQGGSSKDGIHNDL